jgi:hypothetical protein
MILESGKGKNWLGKGEKTTSEPAGPLHSNCVMCTCCVEYWLCEQSHKRHCASGMFFSSAQRMNVLKWKLVRDRWDFAFAPSRWQTRLYRPIHTVCVFVCVFCVVRWAGGWICLCLLLWTTWWVCAQHFGDNIWVSNLAWLREFPA